MSLFRVSPSSDWRCETLWHSWMTPQTQTLNLQAQPESRWCCQIPSLRLTFRLHLNIGHTEVGPEFIRRRTRTNLDVMKEAQCLCKLKNQRLRQRYVSCVSNSACCIGGPANIMYPLIKPWTETFSSLWELKDTLQTGGAGNRTADHLISGWPWATAALMCCLRIISLLAAAERVSLVQISVKQ